MTETAQSQADLEVWVQALAVGAVGHQQRRRRPIQRQPLPVDHRQRHLQRNRNARHVPQDSAPAMLTNVLQLRTAHQQPVSALPQLLHHE